MRRRRAPSPARPASTSPVRRADRRRRPGGAARDDLRRERPRRHLRARLPGRDALPARLRPRCTTAGRRSRSARSSAMRPSGRTPTGFPCARRRRAERPPCRGRGRRPRRSGRRWRARRAGYAVTVFDEREEVGGLVRYAIAPYRQSNEPLPDEARLLEELGVELGWRPASTPRGCTSSRTCSTRSSSPSAWAPTPTSPTTGTTSKASGSRCRSSSS